MPNITLLEEQGRYHVSAFFLRPTVIFSADPDILTSCTMEEIRHGGITLLAEIRVPDEQNPGRDVLFYAEPPGGEPAESVRFEGGIFRFRANSLTRFESMLREQESCGHIVSGTADAIISALAAIPSAQRFGHQA